MRYLYRILSYLHLFVGVGALAGGFAAISNPINPLGMPLEPLKYSPFSNYLIPGIILFTVLGLGNIFSTVMIFIKSRFTAYISGVFSGALVIWIVVQCLMLRDVVFLHVLFFLIGMVEAVLSLIILFEQRLFPANIVIDFYKNLTNRSKA